MTITNIFIYNEKIFEFYKPKPNSSVSLNLIIKLQKSILFRNPTYMYSKLGVDLSKIMGMHKKIKLNFDFI